MRETIKKLLSGEEEKANAVVAGWVRTHRQSKNISFIELNDGSSIQSLQLVIEPSIESYQQNASRITTGASIKAEGQLAFSPAKGQKFELRVNSISIIGEASPEEYPLQKKGHTLEFLREILHLRPRSNTISAVMRVRSAAAQAVHQFFKERGFYYLNTPIITTSDCEGAGEMFQVTTLNLSKIPLSDSGIDFSKDFFSEPAHLTVSGQLDAEIYAMALGLVYTFGPTFRAENSNTARHLAEFWMIEPEMAFYELEDNMSLAQDFIKYVIKYVLNECESDVGFLQQREWADPKLLETLNSVVDKTFVHLDYTEAISVLQNAKVKFEFPVSWGMDLQSEHEKYLCDEYVKGPVFVVNYPKDIKAFYMRLNSDNKTVRAMDLLVPRLGEIIGGSQREERHEELKNRILECGLPLENYWWYLDLRKFGTVPHSGFGLGFERLVMYITGMQNIRDVIPFPRYPGYAKF